MAILALGSNQKPPMLHTHALIEKQYKNGFIAAYAVVMRICALLAFPKTFMSVIFITNEAVKVSDKETKGLGCVLFTVASTLLWCLLVPQKPHQTTHLLLF